MERGFAVHARALTKAALVALVFAGAADAAPKKKDARVEFDRGVAAYGKNDYPTAVAAFAKSFALEEDHDTLYAWAQAEKKQDHCENAIHLYEKLLVYELPAANRKAVGVQIEECRAVMLQTTPPAPVTAVAEPEPQPIVPAPVEPPKHDDGPPSRWKSPVGLGLIGVGVVGVSVGTVFLLQAKRADNDQDSAATYGEWLDLRDKAKSRGTIGVISAGVGAACVAGGIIYIMTREPERASEASVWVTPDSAGVFAAGRF